MKKYIKLNDNKHYLSLGNIINAIKNVSHNKSTLIQSEVFCTLFNIDDANESTINNYCIGSRAISQKYKQIYLNIQNNPDNLTIFKEIIINILTITDSYLYQNMTIADINHNLSFQKICEKLFHISKNDFYLSQEVKIHLNYLFKIKDYYNFFRKCLSYAILDCKQPLYEDEKNQDILESLLEKTNISIIDLQNFLILELNEGMNFSYALKNLANENNPYANYHLAIMEYRGEITGYIRYDKAYEYFLKAASLEHPSATWMLGNMIMKEKLGKLSSNQKEAVHYFEKAIDLGSIAAINSLGLCYQQGLGVSKDEATALKLFKKAANHNYAYALNNLGKFYEKKNNFEEAYKYYLKSANLLESWACNKMGEFYRLQNKKIEAFKYYNAALETSLREKCLWAYYNLGKYYYLTGDLETNTPKDIKKAISYFEISNSLIASLKELLYIYYQENNLPKVYYYQKLIEQHPDFNNALAEEINTILQNLKKQKKIIIP